jgi:NADP-reducing hydrogenase subunit HndB
MERLHSIEELDAFRSNVKKLLKGNACKKDGARILVSCGSAEIGSGVKEIMDVIQRELNKNLQREVSVEKRCCLGFDSEMPIVVVQSNCQYFCYGKVSPEFAKEIVVEHVLNGKPILDRVIARGEVCEEA